MPLGTKERDEVEVQDTHFDLPDDNWEDFENDGDLVTVNGGPQDSDTAAFLAYSTLMAQSLAVPKSRILSFIRHSNCSPKQALALDRHIHWFEWEFNCFARNRRGIINAVKDIIAQIIADADALDAREDDSEAYQAPAANDAAEVNDDDDFDDFDEQDDADEQAPRAAGVGVHRAQVNTALEEAKTYNAAKSRQGVIERRPLGMMPRTQIAKAQRDWEEESETMRECDERVSLMGDLARSAYNNSKYLAWVEASIDDDLRKGLDVDLYDVTNLKDKLRANPKMKLDEIADDMPMSFEKAFQISEMSLSSGHQTRNVGLQALTQGQGYVPESQQEKGWKKLFGRRQPRALPPGQQQGGPPPQSE